MALAPTRLSASYWTSSQSPDMNQGHGHLPAQGAYCELDSLIGARYSAAGLNLNQRRRALSLLAGPNKTNFRGRGIDFEEVRSYQPGDDIRTIDWRVTARTGSAHTKMFREERERPVLLLVDQRPAMFFGSRTCFKSVLAAELAAMLCWAALRNGDRVGGLVFGCGGHREVRPKRSRRSVLSLLHNVDELNHLLGTQQEDCSMTFGDALIDLRRIAKPGSAIFIVSDFDRALDNGAKEHLFQLSQHMEVTAIHCSDPLERDLPRAGRYSVTDGNDRTLLDTGSKHARREFQQLYETRFTELQDNYGRLGIPVIEASTEQAPLDILASYYGCRERRAS